MERLSVKDFFQRYPAIPALAQGWTGLDGERKIVVLDDNPAGTQTVRNVWVCSGWEIEDFRRGLLSGERLFYVLTNSRALTEERAAELYRAAGENLARASAETGVPYVLVSRSGSTLRGHFPAETDALSQALAGAGTPVDGVILCPYFAEGGRYTANNVHYVRQDQELVPIGDTYYAADPVLGFRSSDLRCWVEEKTGGAIRAEQVASVPLEMLRENRVAEITELLSSLRGGCVVVNAAHDEELVPFCRALEAAERAGKRFLCRTSAGFVRVLSGQNPTDAVKLPACSGGGLLVVGSHTPKTTRQLERLLTMPGVSGVELDVKRVLAGDTTHAFDCADRCSELLRGGTTAALYTSRAEARGKTREETFAVSRRISKALCSAVKAIDCRPGFVVTKGGVTSSDVITSALRVRYARVLGSPISGVPVWQAGAGSRYPGILCAIFPGNIGTEDTLVELIQMLSGDL